MAPIRDDDYIDQVISGNTAAYAPLVERYQDMVFSIVMRVVRNAAVAEDISQDVFVKVFQSLSEFQRKAQFSSWLYRIAYNAAISHVRKSKREFTSIDEQVIDNYADEEVQDMVMGLNADEQKKVITRALEMLNERDRVLIEMFYLRDKSIEEIAMITDLTVSNVKVKLHRLRKKLYGEMGRLMKMELEGI
ncbi:MAG: RNA polymerase subunit sigma-70 [Bacteroidetes bacterium]|nr:MAG: RNA polymerase subunit sigma-70 [Bacteroidota bacterium]